MTNQFAPFRKYNQGFVVRNIASPNKMVRIFQFPIGPGQDRDLLDIPGVGEADLRASLLKGELLRKLRANEITITFSDIDLLQFNDNQKQFLMDSGVVNGLEAAGSGGGISSGQHQSLRQLIHFIDNGPANGFTSGAYRELLPASDPFPASVTWWTSSAKTNKIVETLYTYNGNNIVTAEHWKIYDTDGTTVSAQIIDTITSNGALELSRTRTIL